MKKITILLMAAFTTFACQAQIKDSCCWGTATNGSTKFFYPTNSLNTKQDTTEPNHVFIGEKAIRHCNDTTVYISLVDYQRLHNIKNLKQEQKPIKDSGYKKSQWKVDVIGNKARAYAPSGNWAFTGKNIRHCFECVLIGYGAGNSSCYTPVKYAIVIGDHFKDKMVKDYDIVIDKDWWYFKTKEGKIEYTYIMGFVNISAFYYGNPKDEDMFLQNRNQQLKAYIKWKIAPEIKGHYKNHR